ncbi:MAG: S-methyl-5-thioribose-1-phosphate isomerase, partial [Candidatus Caldatribacteriota bacterium]|nr:S-methyl-5-thioribose-1-phosphate isomerase [Candidatus Caldatribacteriota bacterium]
MKTIEWKEGKVFLIDQRKLPLKYEIVKCSSYQEIAEAIKKMKIRGAPAIGVAAAFGMVLAAFASNADNYKKFNQDMEKAKNILALTRPTAVNLYWALNRMMNLIINKQNNKITELKKIILQEAQNISRQDIEINKMIGKCGSSLIKNDNNILTHCNAGALATAGYGTALGLIR